MKRPFTKGLSSVTRSKLNLAIIFVQVAVDHTNKSVKNYYKSRDFSWNMQVRKATIVFLYKASCLQLNFRVCLYDGGQVQSLFKIRASSLRKYLTSNYRDAIVIALDRSLTVRVKIYGFGSAFHKLVLHFSRHNLIKSGNCFSEQLQVGLFHLSSSPSFFLLFFPSFLEQDEFLLLQ